MDQNPPETAERDSEREEIRGILAENIRALDGHIETKWDDELEAEAERLQLTRLRTLGLLARQYRMLARDADVDIHEEKIEFLEDALDVREGGR